MTVLPFELTVMNWMSFFNFMLHSVNGIRIIPCSTVGIIRKIPFNSVLLKFALYIGSIFCYSYRAHFLHWPNLNRYSSSLVLISDHPLRSQEGE